MILELYDCIVVSDEVKKVMAAHGRDFVTLNRYWQENPEYRNDAGLLTEQFAYALRRNFGYSVASRIFTRLQRQITDNALEELKNLSEAKKMGVL